MLARFAYLLARGEVGLIFPEGGRSRSGRVEVDDAAYGVGRIVQGAARLPRALRLSARRAARRPGPTCPARGERFHVRPLVLEPTRRRRGLRGSRDSRSRSSRTLASNSRRRGSMLGNDVVDLERPRDAAGRAPSALRRARLRRRPSARRIAASPTAGAAALDPVGREGERLQGGAQARLPDDRLLAAALRGRARDGGLGAVRLHGTSASALRVASVEQRRRPRHRLGDGATGTLVGRASLALDGAADGPLRSGGGTRRSRSGRSPAVLGVAAHATCASSATAACRRRLLRDGAPARAVALALAPRALRRLRLRASTARRQLR